MSRIFLLLIVLAGGCFSFAENIPPSKLGRLKVSDLFLEPSYIYSGSAGKPSGFSLGNSYVDFGWHLAPEYSARFEVGTVALLNQPRFYPQQSGDLTLTEAFVQMDSSIGRIRMGLIPLCFGWENGMREAELFFPRSLIFAEGIVGQRDLGVSFAVHSGGFYSELIVHNGEISTDPDGELWLTGKWGWRQNGWDAAISGTTGRTTPQSTNPGNNLTATTTDFDPTQSARVRLANVFVAHTDRRVAAVIEGDIGQVYQGHQQDDLQGGHVDLRYSFGHSPLDAMARFDVWQEHWPKLSVLKREYILGIDYHSRYRNSVVSLYGIKQMQRSSPQQIHEVELVWKMTPSF